MELNIPDLLENYNDHAFNPEAFPHVPRRISLLPEEKRPSACIGCRSCEAVCPQNIKISEAMQNFAAKLKG